MTVVKELQQYVQSENSAHRLNFIEELCRKNAPEGQTHAAWHVINLLANRFERAKIANHLLLAERPNQNWALTACLLQDSDQDVVSNAINVLTLSHQRAFGHRIAPFFKWDDRRQRVLYCLARYAEEAYDRRLGQYLSPDLHSEYSDAFLARSFNALLRLGIISKKALDVAEQLILSHQDATNMDRKAALAAVVYFFFAADAKQLKRVQQIQDKITIPELRRLLTWGFAQVEDYFSPQVKDAEKFIKTALEQAEPNFSGYGCFVSKNVLGEALSQVFTKSKEKDAEKITKTILSLGNVELIEILAKNSSFGVDAALKSENKNLIALWRMFMPIESETFVSNTLNTASYQQWHQNNPEILYALFNPARLSTSELEQWSAFYVENLKNNPKTAVDILNATILSIERAQLEQEKQEVPAHILSFAKKLISEFVMFYQRVDQTVHAPLLESVVSIFIGSPLAEKPFQELTASIPFHLCHWTLHSLAADKRTFSQDVTHPIAEHSSHSLLQKMQDSSADKDVFVTDSCHVLESVVALLNRHPQGLSSDGLSASLQTAETIANILEALGASSSSDEESESEEEGSVDWSGRNLVDRPMSRWFSILSVLSQEKFEAETKSNFERILIDSVKSAPHVEKRFVIKALIKLGTNDAIKAILYNAVQHVDHDFVEFTVRELLHSPHPRAQQALIRSVGRNTISDDLKLHILEDMALVNPEDILFELRSLEILNLPQHIHDAVKDAIGRCSALCKEDPSSQKSVPADTTTKSIDSKQIDLTLKKFLPDANALSVDVLSALRTAEMILVQSRSWGSEAVDLSPIVNMHFKAVELVMRECFEPYTDALIRKGALSRKLDLLGYARPIPEKMQIFEDYLGALPVVKTIPYFSKFKLRKMLRGICLYRPGKRFTLDGPKAFALFFLATARQDCQYGLNNMLSLGTKNDSDLFDFIKLVHLLQDSRNRAVHEGLTWEAKEEIETMRVQAYKIIETCQRIGKYLMSQNLSASLQPRLA